jgi:glutamyl-tRNA reductase
MSFVACGINHKTAPLALREQVAFTLDGLAGPLEHLVSQTKASEAAIISTCHRTELYSTGATSDHLIHWLAEHKALPLEQLRQHIYVYHEQAAVRHLMNVACGLDSMCLGETQILGQIKTAYAKACEHGTVGQRLHDIFQKVFGVSKRVRTDTAISVNPLSVASTAVHLSKRIFSQLEDKTCLFIGSGETIDLALKHFYANGVRQLLIANRTLENAETLAAQYAGRAIELADILKHLDQADLIISATASPIPILGKGSVESALKRRKRRPMFIVDLAIPRDIEPEVAELEDVFLYNVDDLQTMIESHLASRQVAAEHAADIIDLEVDAFMQRQRASRADEVICGYRQRLQALGVTEVQKAKTALANGKDPQVVLEQSVTKILNKVLHEPTVALHNAARHEREDVIQLARQLFQLDDETESV